MSEEECDVAFKQLEEALEKMSQNDIVWTSGEPKEISITCDQEVLDAMDSTKLFQPPTIDPPPGFAFKVLDHTIYIFCNCWWCKLKKWIK